MNVLVLGATGFVGRAMVDALVAEGESVRAATRKSPPDGGPASVVWVKCDAREPSSLERAFRGIDCVYYLMHSMADRRHYRKTERRCAMNVARAAAASGCRRIVYLGGVEPAGKPSEHLASRLDVGSILRAGPVPTIELRAAMIVGNGSASWSIVRDLALRLPIMLLPKWLESKSCPIALSDAVRALLDARHVPLRESAWWDIPGPDALKAREMLMIVGELHGRRIPALRVPLLTPRLSTWWLALVSGADRRVARELVLGLRTDLLPRDARYWELTGHPPRSSFREAARSTLAAETRPTGIGGWLASKEEALAASFGRRRRRTALSP